MSRCSHDAQSCQVQLRQSWGRRPHRSCNADDRGRIGKRAPFFPHFCSFWSSFWLSYLCSSEVCKFNRSFIQMRHFTIAFGSLNPCLDFVLRVLSLLLNTERNCCAQLSCLRHSTYGTSGKVTCRTITRLRLIISVTSFMEGRPLSRTCRLWQPQRHFGVTHIPFNLWAFK